MPLSQQQLVRNLESYFKSKNKTAQESGQRLARAYATYATAATSSCTGMPPVLAGKEQALRAALTSAFKTGKSAAQTTTKIAKAFGAFWAGVPFGPGAAAPVIPPLVAKLVAISSLNASKAKRSKEISTKDLAKQWGNALHAWTTTSVIVTYVSPPCVGPII
jgi:hypothetical protein